MAQVVTGLMHLGQDKMAAILQTIVSDAFLWKEIFLFWFEFLWCLLLRMHLIKNQHWFTQSRHSPSIRWQSAVTEKARMQDDPLKSLQTSMTSWTFWCSIITHFWTRLNYLLFSRKCLIQQNEFEKDVCMLSAILFRPSTSYVSHFFHLHVSRDQ